MKLPIIFNAKIPRNQDKAVIPISLKVNNSVIIENVIKMRNRKIDEFLGSIVVTDSTKKSSSTKFVMFELLKISSKIRLSINNKIICLFFIFL